MTIENKELYKLYKSVKKIDFDNGLYGLYLEGFDGGINAYVTDGKAAFRKTFYGDNKAEYVKYYPTVGRIGKAGYSMEESEYKDRFFNELKAYFCYERFNAFTVDGKEFKQAVRGVDAINKCTREHNIVLSVHNGKFDLASWNNGDTAFWQLEGDYNGNGAVIVDKRYLDAVKPDKPLEISYSKEDNKIVLHIQGEIDAVIIPHRIEEDDIKAFMEVLEYEYKAPEKQVIEQVPEVIEPARKPARKKICAVCGEKLVSKRHEKNTAYKCAVCGKVLCGKHSYSYVDGNNRAITIKSPVLCKECYAIKYPHDVAIWQSRPEKTARNPVKRAPKRKLPVKIGYTDTGWTYNRLGTRQIKVCSW